MIPFNFKYLNESHTGLLSRFPTFQQDAISSSFSSPSSSRIMGSSYRIPFNQRLNDSNNSDSNWIARRATDEVKETHDVLKKKISVLHFQEQRYRERQSYLVRKMKSLEAIRFDKSNQANNISRLREESQLQKEDATCSTRLVREQIEKSVRKARENLLNVRQNVKEEISRASELHNDMIAKHNQSTLQLKRQLRSVIKQQDQESFDLKCKYFTQKQAEMQFSKMQKIKDFKETRTNLLAEISQLQEEESRARAQRDIILEETESKNVQMAALLGISKPKKPFSSSKNSQDSSPTHRHNLSLFTSHA